MQLYQITQQRKQVIFSAKTADRKYLLPQNSVKAAEQELSEAVGCAVSSIRSKKGISKSWKRSVEADNMRRKKAWFKDNVLLPQVQFFRVKSRTLTPDCLWFFTISNTPDTMEIIKALRTKNVRRAFSSFKFESKCNSCKQNERRCTKQNIRCCHV